MKCAPSWSVSICIKSDLTLPSHADPVSLICRYQPYPIDVSCSISFQSISYPLLITLSVVVSPRLFPGLISQLLLFWYVVHKYVTERSGVPMKPQWNAIVIHNGILFIQYLNVRVPASSRGSKPSNCLPAISEPRYFVVVIFDWPSFNLSYYCRFFFCHFGICWLQ